MKNRIFTILLLLVGFLATGCDWRGIRGNGHPKTEQRPVSDFTRIEASGFYDIEWHPGPPSLSITTDENLLAHIETGMSGSALRIEIRDTIAPTQGIKVIITSPSLSGAKLSGALRLEASPLSGQRFTLDTSGASRVTLSGQTDRLVASLTGASRLNADSLQTADVEISVTGAGRADIFATHSVKAAITGAGKVSYAGNPEMVQKKVTGAGKISPRN